MSSVFHMGASFVCIVSFCARDINKGGAGVRFEGWVIFFMGTTLLVGLFICNGFWGRYCIDTALLFSFYKCRLS